MNVSGSCGGLPSARRLRHSAGVDELMVGLGGVSPAPSIGEGVELRLAYLSARLAKEDVVIGVRVKRRIEIDKIDTRIGKFFPVRKPFQIIAEI